MSLKGNSRIILMNILNSHFSKYYILVPLSGHVLDWPKSLNFLYDVTEKSKQNFWPTWYQELSPWFWHDLLVCDFGISGLI